jgi:hypothetical protein
MFPGHQEAREQKAQNDSVEVVDQECEIWPQDAGTGQRTAEAKLQLRKHPAPGKSGDALRANPHEDHARSAEKAPEHPSEEGSNATPVLIGRRRNHGSDGTPRNGCIRDGAGV